MANEQNLTPFKDGHPPNNAGRKKGTKNWSTVFKKYAKLKIKPSDIGIKQMFTDEQLDEQLSVQDIIVLRALYRAAKEVNPNSIKLIIERMDGLLKQKFELENIPVEITPDDKNLL